MSKHIPYVLPYAHWLNSHSRSQAEAAGGSTSHLVVKTSPPQLELKSGWDDMLDNRSAKWKLLSRKGTPSPSPPSPTPSRLSSNMDEDKAFMVSTLSYLGSPTAKSLGISSIPHVQPALLSPPPLQSVLPKPPLMIDIPAVPKPPPPLILTSAPPVSPLMTKPIRTDMPSDSIRTPSISISPVWMKPPPTDVPSENMSSVSSVLRAPWPEPPAVPKSVSPVPSPTSASRSYSPTSSDGGMHGYPASSNRKPPPVGSVGVSTSSVTTKKPLKSALKRPSGKEQVGFQGEHLRVIHENF